MATSSSLPGADFATPRPPVKRRGSPQAAERSTAAGEDMPDEVRWIRGYVLEELSGAEGSVCSYQARSPEAIRGHAGNAGLPINQRDHPDGRHGLREAEPGLRGHC